METEKNIGTSEKATKKRKLNLTSKEEERKFIIKCIELYQSMPVLWKVKSDEYMDRDKKAQALERLLKLYQEKFPNATTEDVKNKFNSLRTNFRKELKKIKDSKKSGAGTEEVYEPTLWYFDSMTFLVDQETPSASINTIDDEQEGSLLSDDPSSSTTQTADPHTTITDTPVTAKKRKTQPKDPTDDVIKLAYNRLKEPVDDDFYTASAWAKELKTMATQQKVFAKKFINDIIFEAQMGTLHRNSIKINEPDRYDTPASHSSHSNASYSQIHTMVSNSESQHSEPSASHYFSSFQ